MTFARRYRLDALANTCAELTDEQLSAMEALAHHFTGPHVATSPGIPQDDGLEATRAAAGEASPAESKGARLLHADGRVVAITSDCGSVNASLVTDFAPDLDLDAATAEALHDELRAVTEQPAGDVDLRPGDRVEVVESHGSKTGDRVAIGKFVGYEDDVRGRDYGKWRLVEVYGVIRRFGAVDVRRVG